MKQIIIMLCILLVVTGCTSIAKNPPSTDVSQVTNLQKANLEIEGMTCQSCALGVEYELKQVDGVVDAKIDYNSGTGVVQFDGSKVDAETIAKASTVYSASVVSK